jgi:hypothetical protein
VNVKSNTKHTAYNSHLKLSNLPTCYIIIAYPQFLPIPSLIYHASLHPTQYHNNNFKHRSTIPTPTNPN